MSTVIEYEALRRKQALDIVNQARLAANQRRVYERTVEANVDVLLAAGLGVESAQKIAEVAAAGARETFEQACRPAVDMAVRFLGAVASDG